MHGNGIETSMQSLGDITSRKTLPNKRKYLLLARRKRLVDHLWIRKAPYVSINRCRFADKRPSAQAERDSKGGKPGHADSRIIGCIPARSQGSPDSIRTVLVAVSIPHIAGDDQ